MTHSRFLRQLWISFAIIVACVALSFLAVYYFSSDLSTQADTIVSDRTAVEQQANSVEDLASLERDIPRAVQYQAAMDQLLPDQYGLVTFEQWLSQLGEKYNVTTNAVFQNSVAAPQGTTPGTAGFSFDAEGSSSAVTAFLDEVVSKSSGFLLSLNSFNFTNDGTNVKVVGQGTLFFR